MSGLTVGAGCGSGCPAPAPVAWLPVPEASLCVHPVERSEVGDDRAPIRTARQGERQK